MLQFQCDYSEGAHPRILQALCDTNFEQTPGYGEDIYCQRASELICQKCNAPRASVHFLVGGTQANFILLAAALRPHQGAVCAQSGHINVHESGAVEACGHKVLPLPSTDGKIYAQQVKEYVSAHWQDPTHEHMVQPKLVYISNPTEVGTIYTKAELTALYSVCQENGLYLYIDGARLGFALTCRENDLTLSDIASLCDAFTIGGTKAGALFGEALVIQNHALKQDFRYILKQKGGMLAKGRLLGLQFLTLLGDDLYFALCRHGNEMARKIRQSCEQNNIPLLFDSPTNQQFPILANQDLARLSQQFAYSYWQAVDESHTAVRFCTSWATTPENPQARCSALLAL